MQGRELEFAFDAVSDEDSFTILTEVLAKGGRRWLVLPAIRPKIFRVSGAVDGIGRFALEGNGQRSIS